LKATIAVIPGDGIGPEIVNEAMKVLRRVAQKFGHELSFVKVIAGGAAVDECGLPLPEDSVKACRESGAVLLGAVGGPKWDALPPALRPEQALLSLRKSLGLFANIRPCVLIPGAFAASPLRREISETGFDFVIVRELTGGIYFGSRGMEKDSSGRLRAFDEMVYTESEIERIVKTAFLLSRTRKKKVTSVDKANVLATSRLWRSVVEKVARDFPDVAYRHMLVDTCSMRLVQNPSEFDVIVTENMFGDILSDEGSALTGSIGLIPSMSIGEEGPGLFEPIHGSAPDIAGTNTANPTATVLSCALLLKHLGLFAEGTAVEEAIQRTRQEGYATPDVFSPGKILVSCEKMGDLFSERI